jgi:hypothetical protein
MAWIITHFRSLLTQRMLKVLWLTCEIITHLSWSHNALLNQSNQWRNACLSDFTILPLVIGVRPSVEGGRQWNNFWISWAEQCHTTAVVMVSNEEAKFNSFKLQVKSSDVSFVRMFLREDLWPEGVCIRRYYYRNKNKNMNNDITVHENNGIDEVQNTTRKTLYYNYGWYQYIWHSEPEA